MTFGSAQFGDRHAVLVHEALGLDAYDFRSYRRQMVRAPVRELDDVAFEGVTISSLPFPKGIRPQQSETSKV
jgi:hypothetical protein